MQSAEKILTELGIGYQTFIMSAHRTPRRVIEFAENAAPQGIKVIIAAAGGAAHLGGVIAALTPLPVLGVPMPTAPLSGLDSLLSMVQMPGGIPVATFAIGTAGAK